MSLVEQFRKLPIRQRDYFIAEKVLGWRWIEGAHWDVSVSNVKGTPLWLLPDWMGVGDVPAGEWTYIGRTTGHKLSIYGCGRYSQSWDDSEAVITRLLDRKGPYGCYKMHFFLHRWPDGPLKWRANFQAEQPVLHAGSADARSAAEAICLAALAFLDAKQRWEAQQAS